MFSWILALDRDGGGWNRLQNCGDSITVPTGPAWSSQDGGCPLCLGSRAGRILRIQGGSCGQFGKVLLPRVWAVLPQTWGPGFPFSGCQCTPRIVRLETRANKGRCSLPEQNWEVGRGVETPGHSGGPWGQSQAMDCTHIPVKARVRPIF